MATTERSRRDSGSPGGSASPMDQLLGELGDYLAARAGDLADKAADKIDDLTDQLSGVAEGGGTLADIGGRLLQGDSPVKAAVGGTLGGLVDKAKDVGSGLLGGGKGKGRKGGSKPTHIAESIDIGVPLRTAYDHWTRFEDFSGFAKGVRSVSQDDDTTSAWNVKVGPSTRSWKATVQEQIPDDRIIWSSDGPKGTTRGCVSFHELGPSLTRILLIVEYYPSGLFEKTGNLWRAQGRRMRLDLKHFVRHVTLSGDEEPDGWRGEIRDGEVVTTHEEALEQEERDEAEGDEEGEQEYDEEDAQDEEPEAEEGDEEYADEYEDEEQPEDEEGDEEEGEDEDEDTEDSEETDEYEEEPEPEEEPQERPRRRRRR
ncbi:SRPBCC family protein [Streptomyces sp. NPDC048387]|uniref:SRPBCC family protein n=1 Tax=Streptomyces sp. NPDC048387 TaxID=3365542 RepID=UPI00371AAE4D